MAHGLDLGWRVSPPYAVLFHPEKLLAYFEIFSPTQSSNQVKSFANVVVSMTATQISSLKSIPTTWSWSYTGSSIVADVAYDMFTSSTAGGTSAYEIMIWLAALGGAGPISSTGSPVATVTIDGVSWKLYSGLNGSMKVFSFVASSQATSFTGSELLTLSFLERRRSAELMRCQQISWIS